jgi:hypothetical protein
MYVGRCGSSPSVWRSTLMASASDVSLTNASGHTLPISSCLVYELARPFEEQRKH